jgi:hypothetical protein
MSPTRQDTLLAALQRKATPRTPSAAASPAKHDPPPNVSAPRPQRRVGKPVQFWLHEEDRKLIRELAAWLAGQGIRSTDSMVVRAALRMAKTGSTFVDAYRQASLLDGRLKQR